MKPAIHTTRHVLALSLLATAFATAALAQAPAPTGGAVLASEPGKAALLQTVEVSAQVVAIDQATRTLTLKGSKGNVMDLVAGDEVKKFDQIKLGDLVVARYVEALTLELKKTKAGSGIVTMSEDVAKAKPGERPAIAGARQVTAMVTVVVVDPKASTVTVKGPTGNLTTLKVRNPDQFKVVKQGDQIEATYTVALALSVEPAPKAAAAAKP